ncbi:hypothetical protein FHS18_003104 [Paenibacillus phyllosphaerae]|uniref:Uncharacterized protein n=1 Tax=Paenibacillus phyllosphaerae TaxID=274593 RepID=A0A7W5AZR7_9BACL|nr:hypothetical protein [Paenibacillus phyllosphaerae]
MHDMTHHSFYVQYFHYSIAELFCPEVDWYACRTVRISNVYGIGSELASDSLL